MYSAACGVPSCPDLDGAYCRFVDPALIVTWRQAFRWFGYVVTKLALWFDASLVLGVQICRGIEATGSQQLHLRAASGCFPWRDLILELGWRAGKKGQRT